MSSNDDETSATDPEITSNGAVPPDDPRVTPLGGNAGVHIQTEEEPTSDDPAIDFGGFIVSLGTSCMVNLGRHADPETGVVQRDLEAAAQVIDILEMLRKKTRGNLDYEEKQLLKTLLHDLRRAYDESSE